MCSAGIDRVAATGRWTDLLSIVGYALGLGALVVIGAGLLEVSLPFATSRRQSL